MTLATRQMLIALVLMLILRLSQTVVFNKRNHLMEEKVPLSARLSSFGYTIEFIPIYCV
jgi:hypothetical protein